MSSAVPSPAPRAIDAPRLAGLIAALTARGYRVIGPTLRDGAILYEEVTGLDDLPAGWTDRQDAGTYRLEARADGALFGYAVGPSSWKRFLHPPEERLWRARREGDGQLAFSADEPAGQKLAFLGVRACEIRAIAIQDRVLTGDSYPDPRYAARRAQILLIAVNCADPAATCFCASMGTGPRVEGGYDLALTELAGPDHRFLIQAGSEAGAELLAALSAREAAAEEIAAAGALSEAAAARMGRRLETAGLQQVLRDGADHPHWDEVAARCLGCANCTMVCPTCFCTSVADHTDLAGGEAERVRRWDSCFNLNFSFIHGGPVRNERAARYRQWLTHKLSSWIDQFGTSGCVGCGRCIAWCPVGIDITAEAAAIRGATAREEHHGRT